MKLYDITRDLFSAPVYPGDPKPYPDPKLRMSKPGTMCNLSGFYAGCHSGTHVDAPMHFVDGAAAIDELPVDRFVGTCTVVTLSGVLTGQQMEILLPFCDKMILFHGNGQAFLDASAAIVLGEAGVTLVGTDAQSIGPAGNEQVPHLELLNRNMVILEGVDLTGVPDGHYTLCCLPLKLKGLEASPVRAVLMQEEETK
ncbi:MAG TPA: cyclase family protein [Firmicutes bacterium]|nr:cyclase family protein [Bacillota bacterium]